MSTAGTDEPQRFFTRHVTAGMSIRVSDSCTITVVEVMGDRVKITVDGCGSLDVSHPPKVGYGKQKLRRRRRLNLPDT